MGQDQDDVVIVPYTTELKRINRETWLDSILVQAVSASCHAQRAAGNHRPAAPAPPHPAGRPMDFIVRSQEDIAEAATATARIMGFLLAGVAAVSR